MKVGDIVFERRYRYGQKGLGEPEEVTITKVGRVWSYYGKGHRADRFEFGPGDGPHEIDRGEFGGDVGFVFLTLKAATDHDRRLAAWDEIRTATRWGNTAPRHLDADALEALAAQLKEPEQ